MTAQVAQSGTDLAILLSFSGQGGVERMMLKLIREFAAAGVRLDLLPLRDDSLQGVVLPETVRLVSLGVRHSLTSVLPLALYLRKVRPAAILVAKDRAIRAAVVARNLAGVETRIVGRLGTNLSASMENASSLRRALRIGPMRRLYRSVSKIVAVSDGVGRDVSAVASVSADRICIIRNPVVDDELYRLAEADCPHPWLEDPVVPVVLGVGRLTRQKDFAGLMRAFASLRQTCRARLVILGEGKLRPTLEALASELNLQSDFLLPGHVANPHAWVSRASVFVLSSAWEGSPNALTEALALGVPVVATDCPSGPREILREGKIAPLVAVRDVPGLAAAIAKCLARPPSPDLLRSAAAEYTASRSAQRYLEVLGLRPEPRANQMLADGVVSSNAAV